MSKPTDQTWLPVSGWEGLYEVSSLGQVRSCLRRRGSPARVLKTPIGNRGYAQLNLCRDGVRLHTHVHVLVATAFHGPCPPGMETRHLDGDRTNNRADNLAWGTQSENNFDRVRHGTFRNRNTGKTRCDHDHELAGDNLGVWSDGRRYCVACRKRRNREQAARRLLARRAAKALT